MLLCDIRPNGDVEANGHIGKQGVWKVPSSFAKVNILGELNDAWLLLS
jgi:hypothetical protein